VETQNQGKASPSPWLQHLGRALPTPSPRAPDAAQHLHRAGKRGETATSQGRLHGDFKVHEYEGKQMKVTSQANMKH